MRILLRSKLQRFQQYNIGVGAGPTGPVLLFDDLMGFIAEYSQPIVRLVRSSRSFVSFRSFVRSFVSFVRRVSFVRPVSFRSSFDPRARSSFEQYTRIFERNKVSY